jgi:hypothetical protein
MSQVNPTVRQKILEEGKYTCAICQVSALPRLYKDDNGYRVFNEHGQMTKKAITLDHIIPKSKGGTNREINLLILCNKCNCDKNDKDTIEWFQGLNESIQTQLKKKIFDAIKWHNNNGPVSNKVLLKESIKIDHKNIKAILRRFERLIKKKTSVSFIRVLVFCLLIIPLSCFCRIMKLTKQWENFIQK